MPSRPQADADVYTVRYSSEGLPFNVIRVSTDVLTDEPVSPDEADWVIREATATVSGDSFRDRLSRVRENAEARVVADFEHWRNEKKKLAKAARRRSNGIAVQTTAKRHIIRD